MLFCYLTYTAVPVMPAIRFMMLIFCDNHIIRASGHTPLYVYTFLLRYSCDTMRASGYTSKYTSLITSTPCYVFMQ